MSVREKVSWLLECDSAHRPFWLVRAAGRSSDDAGAVLRSYFRCDLVLYEVSDSSTCSFDKCELLGKASLKQHANAIVAGHVGGGNQRNVLTDAQMN
jgi:hypothetical protein